MSLLDELQTHDAFSPSSSPTVSVSAILASLLSNCSSLESLSLNVGGSLVPKAILPVFRDLDCLRKLKLENWEREEIRPLCVIFHSFNFKDRPYQISQYVLPVHIILDRRTYVHAQDIHIPRLSLDRRLIDTYFFSSISSDLRSLSSSVMVMIATLT